MGAGVMDPVWEELGRVQVPFTFVAGQLDHGYVASARRLAATVPNGRVDIVLRSGHPVHQERPDAFARVLLNHLEQASGGVIQAEGQG
jgi:pimeloyl-ACP methyl ester carboxylesterase